jgi:hypothetical protein
MKMHRLAGLVIGIGLALGAAASASGPKPNVVVILADDLGNAELFDLTADPGEKNDVAAQNPAVVRELEARLMVYARQQRPSEWLKAQPDYLGAQGHTLFDPDFDIDDGGLPHAKRCCRRSEPSARGIDRDSR